MIKITEEKEILLKQLSFKSITCLFFPALSARILIVIAKEYNSTSWSRGLFTLEIKILGLIESD